MTGGVSGTEEPPVSVAGGVGGGVTTEGTTLPGGSAEYGTTGTSYPPTGGSPGSTGSTGSTSEQAAESGKHVAGVAREQASGVTSEARQQTRKLMDQAGGEVRSQAQSQQQRLAGSLRSIGQELSSMSDGTVQPGQSGPATQMTRQLSQYTHQAAEWLEQREPGEILDEVRRFARRRPGTFLAIAAVGGLVAGRLTRGLAASGQNGSGGRGQSNGWTGNGSGYGAGYGTGAAYGTEPGYGSEAGYGSGYTDPAYGSGTGAVTDPGYRAGMPERTATVPTATPTGTPTGTPTAMPAGLDRDEPLP
jgi:hypothetical protein